MEITKTDALNLIEIWQPRYKDSKVLIATYKVKERNKVVFTKAKHLMDKEFFIRGSEIRKHTTTTNGKITCYEVPLDKLEQIEYKKEDR